MAGLGPAPKLPEQRRNANAKLRGEWVDIPPVNTNDIPPMPVPASGSWHSMTVAAWDSWWRDPASTQWTDADLTAVVQLLVLTEQFNVGHRSAANEMRLRSDGLGLTQKGKRDMRWRVVPEVAEAPQAPKPAAKRRARLKVV